NPYIYFDRWFFNAGGNGFPNDSLTIALSNGSVSQIIDFADVNDPDLGTWVTKSFQLSSIMAITNNMRLTIRAMDVNSGHIAEAGFDKFLISEGPLSVDDVDVVNSIVVYPNPFNSEINILFKNTEVTTLKVEVLDVTGKIIDTRVFENTSTIRFKNAYKKGIYFMNVYGDGELMTTEKLIKL
ncbi:MAG: T9SS type A sorting domain-containing protein, partial [Flavobacteriales bacterium]|nr:T9SS type A sorting domain-containing protein [Flavobacteriales bacterium]